MPGLTPHGELWRRTCHPPPTQLNVPSSFSGTDEPSFNLSIPASAFSGLHPIVQQGLQALQKLTQPFSNYDQPSMGGSIEASIPHSKTDAALAIASMLPYGKLLKDTGFLADAAEEARYVGNSVTYGKQTHAFKPAGPAEPLQTDVNGTGLSLYRPTYFEHVLGVPEADGTITTYGRVTASPKGIGNMAIAPQYRGKGLSQVLLDAVDRTGFPLRPPAGDPVSKAGAAAVNKYTAGKQQ